MGFCVYPTFGPARYCGRPNRLIPGEFILSEIIETKDLQKQYRMGGRPCLNSTCAHPWNPRFSSLPDADSAGFQLVPRYGVPRSRRWVDARPRSRPESASIGTYKTLGFPLLNRRQSSSDSSSFLLTNACPFNWRNRSGWNTIDCRSRR